MDLICDHKCLVYGSSDSSAERYRLSTPSIRAKSLLLFSFFHHPSDAAVSRVRDLIKSGETTVPDLSQSEAVVVDDDEEFGPEASGKKVVKNSTVSPSSATLVKVPPRVSPPLDTESIMGAEICQYTSVANNPVTTWTTIDGVFYIFAWRSPAVEVSLRFHSPRSIGILYKWNIPAESLDLVSKCMKHQDNRYAAAYLQPYLTEILITPPRDVITRDKLVSPKDAAFLMIKIRFSPVESRY
ncbi:hypothetical protein PROFUN_16229 [Planoprotostelium fungivorum]|uniref:Uncharacterized protein n=1 Tax=Planoprotostelium fungivorum TaxID=1890364 RepID=A0A2P6MPM2_9EUKA|nr:hypothetical protein PROFUN_16229 [Planoprotostelium fungivorum]